MSDFAVPIVRAFTEPEKGSTRTLGDSTQQRWDGERWTDITLRTEAAVVAPSATLAAQRQTERLRAAPDWALTESDTAKPQPLARAEEPTGLMRYDERTKSYMPVEGSVHSYTPPVRHSSVSSAAEGDIDYPTGGHDAPKAGWSRRAKFGLAALITVLAAGIIVGSLYVAAWQGNKYLRNHLAGYR